jgi:hypothetical protein
MIFITWPGMVLLLLPTIAAEWAFIIRRISLQKRKVLWATAAANALSTIVGIPFTWSFLFVCELGFWGVLSYIPKLGNRGWNSPLEQIVVTIISALWMGPGGSNLTSPQAISPFTRSLMRASKFSCFILRAEENQCLTAIRAICAGPDAAGHPCLAPHSLRLVSDSTDGASRSAAQPLDQAEMP